MQATIRVIYRLVVRNDRVPSGNSTEPSGGPIVVPKQPTESRATADRAMRRLSRRWDDQPVLQTLMIPLQVIVVREGRERATEMRLPQHHETVQAFFFH
jgi:hypothetical protein